MGFCKDSVMPCFKSNRFNCFFKAAAAIIHHHMEIKTFLEGGILPEGVNQKVKSLSADIQDKKSIELR